MPPKDPLEDGALVWGNLQTRANLGLFSPHIFGRLHNRILAIVVTDILRIPVPLLHPVKMSTTISAEEFTNVTSRQKQLNFESSKHVEVDQRVLEGLKSF